MPSHKLPNISPIDDLAAQLRTTDRRIAALERASGGTGGGGGPGPASASYVHSQGVAAATWVINHGLNIYPNYNVIDSTGANVEGDATYDDLNQMTITFSAAFTGTAYLS